MGRPGCQPAANAQGIRGENGLRLIIHDGGGGLSSSGGGYALAGTIGQPDVGTLSGGAYALLGGFWKPDSRSGEYPIFLPVIQK